MFLNQSSDSKSLFNPVIGAGDLALLDKLNYNYLTTVEQQYGANLFNGTYEKIPNNYKLYMNLYVSVSNILESATDYRMIMLMTLVRELLSGAFHSLNIYGSSVLLQADKVNLQQQIQDILSNKNVKNIDTVGATGQLSVTKSFKLASVFNYYIIVYGLPTPGIGFDPIKVSYLADLLKKNNIDPFM